MSTTVVALDESEGARHALDWAMAHGDTETRYVVITVLPTAQPGLGFPPPAAEQWAHAETFAQQTLDAALAHAVRSGIKAESEVVQGSPAGEVLDAVRRHHADQLVLGARGSGGFARLMIGSVASAAIHHAPCPVTIVPLPGHRD